MEPKEIPEIILLKLSNRPLNAQDQLTFEQWLAEDCNRSYYESLLRVKSGVIAAESASVDKKKAWNKVRPPAGKITKGLGFFRYAAILAICASLGLGYLVYQNRQDLLAGNAVSPGTAHAVFISPSGNRIVLTDNGGTVYDENGIPTMIGSPDATTILGETGMPLVIDTFGQGTAQAAGDGNTKFYEVRVPRGGYWTMILADNTKIYLNNESCLRYPARFEENERTVEIEGEAYFEVANDPSRPFVVRTADYDVRVTGTQFNIRSYEAGGTSTTLVEGGVVIEKDGFVVAHLTPHKQATVIDGGVYVKEVDVSRCLSWRDGAFSFNQTPLEEIMEDLARWYDIEIVWAQPDARNFHFTAWFNRNDELEDIIDILRRTNRTGMKLKGRTLIIGSK